MGHTLVLILIMVRTLKQRLLASEMGSSSTSSKVRLTNKKLQTAERFACFSANDVVFDSSMFQSKISKPPKTTRLYSCKALYQLQLVVRLIPNGVIIP